MSIELLPSVAMVKGSNGSYQSLPGFLPEYAPNGLTDAAKTALLNIAKHIGYDDQNGDKYYRALLVALDKSLLRLDKELGAPDNTAWANSTKRKFVENTYVRGLSRNNYYAPDNGPIVTHQAADSITMTAGSASGFGVCYPLVLQAEQRYRFYSDGSKTGSGAMLRTIAYYTEDGSLLDKSDSWTSKEYIFVVPADAHYTLIGFAPEPATGTNTFFDVSLEGVQ